MTIPLNPKLFDTDVEQAPIRAGFGEGKLNDSVHRGILKK